MSNMGDDIAKSLIKGGCLIILGGLLIVGGIFFIIKSL